MRTYLLGRSVHAPVKLGPPGVLRPKYHLLEHDLRDRKRVDLFIRVSIGRRTRKRRHRKTGNGSGAGGMGGRDGRGGAKPGEGHTSWSRGKPWPQYPERSCSILQNREPGQKRIGAARQVGLRAPQENQAGLLASASQQQLTGVACNAELHPEH